MEMRMASRKHFTASEDDFLDLVSQVYDASLDDSRWNTTLQSIAEFLLAEQINLRIFDQKNCNVNLYYFHNRDPYWVQVYKNYYYQIDPWIDVLDNSIACTNHILSDREYRNLEIYNEYIVPTNGHFGIGGLVNVNDEINI